MRPTDRQTGSRVTLPRRGPDPRGPGGRMTLLTAAPTRHGHNGTIVSGPIPDLDVPAVGPENEHF